MTAAGQVAAMDWLRAFLPLGTRRGDAWTPAGAGVLLLDAPVLWLLTTTTTVDRCPDEALSTWVPAKGGPKLLDLSRSQQQMGLTWVRDEQHGLAASLVPIDPSFELKAFSAAQSTSVRDLQPLQPTAIVGCLYGPDIPNPGHPAAAVFDGIVCRVDAAEQRIFTTAPLPPRNIGAPLLLASPFGGPITLAGLVTGSVLLGDVDPRSMPLRLSVAVGVDPMLRLIRGEGAKAQLRLAAERTGIEPDGQTRRGAP